MTSSSAVVHVSKSGTRSKRKVGRAMCSNVARVFVLGGEPSASIMVWQWELDGQIAEPVENSEDFGVDMGGKVEHEELSSGNRSWTLAELVQDPEGQEEARDQLRGVPCDPGTITCTDHGGVGGSREVHESGQRQAELVTALYPIRSRAIISEITDEFRRSQVFLQDVYDSRISWKWARCDRLKGSVEGWTRGFPRPNSIPYHQLGVYLSLGHSSPPVESVSHIATT
ncbi:hypothetical protein BGY98DRAFT_931116 [Russula aff. rugulosa BPL654]|nr:hypothetical protein BGY98DRAFT_931116 [Russula aff. rugulosa BPL654]